jgi:hypothetical protein
MHLRGLVHGPANEENPLGFFCHLDGWGCNVRLFRTLIENTE